MTLTTNDIIPNTRFGITTPGATFTESTTCFDTSTSITLESSSSVTPYTSVTGFTFVDQNNGSYYFLSDSTENWLKADLDCQSKGGQLVHISDQAENEFVEGIITNNNTWIGLYQNCNLPSEEPDGGWQWTDGTTLDYANWDEEVWSAK